MKFQEYINEETKKYPVEEMANMIKKDCKSFLKEVGENSIYRGYKKQIKTIERIKSRSDRKPLGTPKEDHDMLNKMFKKKFGWKARSEGVFCSNDINDVQQYGIVHLFYPIGQYKYVWSPKVKDLTVNLEDFDNYEDDFDTFDEYVEWIISTYKDTGLKDAISYEHEVSVKCKEYYLVHPFHDIHDWL